MPDATKKTLSATEAPALFDASPYATRWMLFRKFAHGDDLSVTADGRMDWGLRMQPLLLAQAAADLKLEVTPNAGDQYVRRGLLGCTRDAVVTCPDRGPGTLETKCVFDFGVWARDWQSGKAPPKHIEIQTQQQMYVGDGETPFRWGVIAAWVCGEMHYFERAPLPELWSELEKEASRFFDDVANGREPNAFGEAVEWPLMAKLFAIPSGRVLDLRDDPQGIDLAGAVIAMESNGEARLFHEKSERAAKNKIIAALNGADRGLFAGGVVVDVKRSARKGYEVKPTTSVSLKSFIPQTTRDDPPRPAPKGEPMLTDLAGG